MTALPALDILRPAARAIPEIRLPSLPRLPGVQPLPQLVSEYNNTFSQWQQRRQGQERPETGPGVTIAGKPTPGPVLPLRSSPEVAGGLQNRRSKPRLDPEDPETYEKLRPTVQRVAEQSSGWSDFFSGLMRVIDVIDIPRMAVNQALNLVIGAKASSPEPSILGGQRIYGADVMRRFGIENRAAQLVGGFLWDVVTDPLSWLTGFGGAAKTAAKVSVGGKAAVLQRGVAKTARQFLGQGQSGKALKFLSESAGVPLAQLDSLVPAAAAAGRGEDLARILGATARQAGEAGIDWTRRVAQSGDELAGLLTEIGKSRPAAIGSVFEELVVKGGLARKGLRLSTEPLRNFPLLGRGFKKVLPAGAEIPLTLPGVLAQSPRTLYGIAGATAGGLAADEGDTLPAMIGGAALGAIAGPRLGRFMKRSKGVDAIRKSLVAVFGRGGSAKVRHLERIRKNWQRAVGAANQADLETVPGRAVAEIEDFRKLFQSTTGVDLGSEGAVAAARLFTNAQELADIRPDDMISIMAGIIADTGQAVGKARGGGLLASEAWGTLSGKLVRGKQAVEYSAPELKAAAGVRPTHLIVPDQAGGFSILKANVDDAGKVRPQRVDAYNTLDEAVARVEQSMGGKALVLEADESGRLLSPAARDPSLIPPEARLPLSGGLEPISSAKEAGAGTALAAEEPADVVRGVRSVARKLRKERKELAAQITEFGQQHGLDVNELRAADDARLMEEGFDALSTTFRGPIPTELLEATSSKAMRPLRRLLKGNVAGATEGEDVLKRLGTDEYLRQLALRRDVFKPGKDVERILNDVERLAKNAQQGDPQIAAAVERYRFLSDEGLLLEEAATRTPGSRKFSAEYLAAVPPQARPRSFPNWGDEARPPLPSEVPVAGASRPGALISPEDEALLGLNRPVKSAADAIDVGPFSDELGRELGATTDGQSVAKVLADGGNPTPGFDVLELDRTLAPPLAAMVRNSRGRYLAQEVGERSAGALESAAEAARRAGSTLDEPWKVAYVPHRITAGEAQKQNRLVGWFSKAVKRRKQAFQNLRSNKAQSIEEINAAYAARGGGKELFETNPAWYETLRTLEHNRAMGNAHFLAEVADQYGTKIPKSGAIPKGLVKITGTDSKLFAALDGYAFHSDVADYLKRVDRLWRKPGPMMEAFDKVLGTLKGWMLTAPAYHGRNLVSNAWQMMAGEGFGLASVHDGYRALWAARQGHANRLGRVLKGTVNPATKNPYTWGELIDQLDSLGLTNKTFFDEPIDQAVRKILDGQGGRAAAQKLKPWQLDQYNRRIGSFLEDGSKVSFVVERLKRGDALQQAVDRAQRFLFDYTDLTAFERQNFRRLFPFYSWAKNNVALQVDLLFERPEIAAMYPKLKGSIEGSLPEGQVVPDALRPDYVRKEAGTQIGGGLTPAFMNLPNLLPLSELKYLSPGGLARGAVDLANPMLKGPIELAINKDLFFDKPIRSYPGQTSKFVGLDVPPELAHVAGVFRPASEINRITYGMQRGEDLSTIAGRFTGLRVFEGNLPREIARFERRQAETRGYMRAKAKIALANNDVAGAERIAALFDDSGMGEDAIKTRMLIAESTGDYGAARQLAMDLADRARQRKAVEVGQTQVAQLSRDLKGA